MIDKIFAKTKVSRAHKKDIREIARIASESFSGLKEKKDAIKWITCNFNAFPIMQYFIAKQGKEIAGYILWSEKGGFRKESVVELEQLAVDKTFQGQGVGSQLIEKSFLEIKNYLKKRKSFLKIVQVTTGSENYAQNLYKKTLGVESECVIKDLFRGDEIIMVARFNKS
jgi:ribosomal protein S18 acetylase RimI-like enzyme